MPLAPLEPLPQGVQAAALPGVGLHQESGLDEESPLVRAVPGIFQKVPGEEVEPPAQGPEVPAAAAPPGQEKGDPRRQEGGRRPVVGVQAEERALSEGLPEGVHPELEPARLALPLRGEGHPATGALSMDCPGARPWAGALLSHALHASTMAANPELGNAARVTYHGGVPEGTHRVATPFPPRQGLFDPPRGGGAVSHGASQPVSPPLLPLSGPRPGPLLPVPAHGREGAVELEALPGGAFVLLDGIRPRGVLLDPPHAPGVRGDPPRPERSDGLGILPLRPPPVPPAGARPGTPPPPGPRPSPGGRSPRNALFALAITAFETWTPQQFPVHPGHAWLSLAPGLGLAPWFGVPLLSLASTWAALSLAGIRARNRDRAGPAFLALTLAANLALPLPPPLREGDSTRIRMVQANIGNLVKLDGADGRPGSVREILARHYRLSTFSEKEVDLVLWPETAYPRMLNSSRMRADPESVPEVFRRVALETGAHLVAGGYDRAGRPGRLQERVQRRLPLRSGRPPRGDLSQEDPHALRGRAAPGAAQSADGQADQEHLLLRRGGPLPPVLVRGARPRPSTPSATRSSSPGT